MKEPPRLVSWLSYLWLAIDCLIVGKVMAAVVAPIGEGSPLLAILVGIPLGTAAGVSVAFVVHFVFVKICHLTAGLIRELRLALTPPKQIVRRNEPRRSSGAR